MKNLIPDKIETLHPATTGFSVTINSSATDSFVVIVMTKELLNQPLLGKEYQEKAINFLLLQL